MSEKEGELKKRILEWVLEDAYDSEDGFIGTTNKTEVSKILDEAAKDAPAVLTEYNWYSIEDVNDARAWFKKWYGGDRNVKKEILDKLDAELLGEK